MQNKISMRETGEITVKEAYQICAQRKRIANLSPATLKYYDDCCKYFLEYAGENFLCNEITEDHVFNYVEYVKEKNPEISAITINTYLRGLRAIFYFFMERGYTSQFKIELVKAVKKIKPTYTDEELELLLAKPDAKTCSFSEYRNWALVCYMLGTGNRRKTVCNVKIKDIDFSGHEVVLQEVKSKKQYTIPLSQYLEKALKEYLSYRKGAPEDYLFCTEHGQQLTEEGLATAIERYNHSRGVLKTSLHMFRHTFAKKWILNGGGELRLQRILGHSTLEMVREYVNMFGSDLQRNFDIYSPLDNMDCLKKSGEHIKIKKYPQR